MSEIRRESILGLDNIRLDLPIAGVGSRALAACRGRNFVVPDDVKELTPWVLRHRLRLRPEAEIEGVTADDVIREVLDHVEAPKKVASGVS